MSAEIAIVAARRTPIGAFQSVLSKQSAPQLGAVAVRAALSDAGVDPGSVDDAILGCCLFGGLGQAPARQAVRGAGLPDSVPCSTLSKMCGSGMKAAMLMHDQLRAGSIRVGLAGGMESMSNAPYLLARARSGYRLGHGELLDHMYRDGLEDAYEGRLMGYYADRTAERFGWSRAEQDAYAAESVRRALSAQRSGAFLEEIAPVAIEIGRGASTTVAEDEIPATCDVSRLPSLRPPFSPEGTVTAGNASSIADGAAALVMMRMDDAEAVGIRPLARVVGYAGFASAPAEFTTAPAEAVRGVLDRAGWRATDVDLYEINEAFAVVTLIAMKELEIGWDKVNVHGGACALGHPIGATGARIIVSLVHALRHYRLRRGIAALCIGGGEATAMAIEAC
ncbi:MAG TPA: acetyl-CoA C-acyltransferase [Azoarcus taiwanensis]|nr:acetyl-CoA C-acyltransferase [Azoarcus taiwanensis]